MKHQTYLAQVNIGQFLYEKDDPRLEGFMSKLDQVNAVADRSKGFVWRLHDDTGNAIDQEFIEGEDVLLNMSIWQTVEDFEHFVWNTVHKKIYHDKSKWFEPKVVSKTLGQLPHFAMWFIEAGHIPTIAEAREKLNHLKQYGNTEEAFDWSYLPHIQLWKQQACG